MVIDGASPFVGAGEHRLELSLDMRVYRLLAIKKAAYRVAERCTVVLGSTEFDRLAVTLCFRPGTGEKAVQEAIRRFHQELLDEELRAVIHEETDALRALILAHTFSRTDLVER